MTAKPLTFRPEGIVFDMMDTLAVMDVRAYRACLVDAARVLDAPLDRFLEAWRTSRQLSSCGQLADTRARLAWISCRLSVPPSHEPLGPSADAIDRVWSDHVSLYDDTLETLQRLRRLGFKLGVLSNGPRAMLVLKTALKIQHLVDAFIISCEIGCTKPQPEAYRTIVDRLAIPPRKTLFVGDGNDKELEGAQRAGLYAVRVRRDTVGDLHDISETCDFEVTSLAALGDWLDAKQ